MAINTRHKPPRPDLHRLEQRFHDIVVEAKQRAVKSGRLHFASATAALQMDSSWFPELVVSTQNEDTVMYWRNHVSQFEYVGVGAVLNVEATGADRFTDLATAWTSCKERMVATTPNKVQFLLGFSFGEGRLGGQWEGWPNGLLVLPRTLFISRPNGYTEVTISKEVGPDTLVETAVKSSMDVLTNILQCQGVGNLETEGHLRLPTTTRPLGKLATDERCAFESIVLSTAADIKAGKYEKAVMARCVESSDTNLSDVPRALRYLAKVYPTNTTFALRRNGQCFVGASPERLATVQRNRVYVDCLAGTTARGASEAEDEALAEWLENSDKNLREHQLVVDGIQAALQSLVDRVVIDRDRTIYRLNNVQHLYSRVTGQLLPGITLFDVARLLHPTPAISGYPKNVALAAISEKEQFDRGWYAGGIGVMDMEGQGDIAVTLRSALVSSQGATLFAGAGIMGDSDPTTEWLETTMKLKPMLQALGIDEGGHIDDGE